jgi:hypothetical protein
MMLKRLIKYTLIIFAAGVVGLAAYGWYLSAQVEKRFSARRWSIPSKVSCREGRMA